MNLLNEKVKLSWDDRRLIVQQACSECEMILVDFWCNETPKIVFTFRSPGGTNQEHWIMYGGYITSGELHRTVTLYIKQFLRNKHEDNSA